MRFRCLLCRLPPPMPPGHHLEFEGDLPSCPKCGAGAGAVVPLVDVHFLVMDANGPIVGGFGLRQRVACNPKRDRLATMTEHYSASDVPQAVTCPSCMGTKEFQQAAKGIEELRMLLAAREALKKREG